MAAKREAKTEDINEEVIFKHNLLVDHLSVHMVEDDFQSLKDLFKDCPCAPKDFINTTTVQELFVKLKKNENISIGHYEYFTEQLEKVDKSLASYVRREEQEIRDILNAGLLPAKLQRTEQESFQQSNPDSNINPVGAERVSQLMESFISVAVPGETKSSASSENTGTIANPEIFCGAVANPTTGNCNQLTINYIDNREYKDEINVETMKVKYAENLSIGKQTVLPQGGPPVADPSAASSGHSQKIHSDLLPVIESTRNMIKTEKEKKFMPTQAYHDAQDKLRKNRVLVIKGNTGDGKTSTAFQILNWLIEEQQCRTPLQLHKIEKLDLLAPHSDVACIIDDIFGERDIGRLDVQEWNKRLKHVETLFVSKQNQTNYLLITIRNEIFNVLEGKSLGTVFMKDNIIDLSSNEYKIKEEKQKLLAMYTPTNLTWTEEEEKKILGYATHIGFPQCCQLFYNSVELQKKRAEFFEKPVKFFIQALSNLPECSAILFLFLNDGEIKLNDLDPNGDKVDKTLLEQAFRIKLVNSEDRTKREYEEKVDFVRESLDKLLGFLVRKEKQWSGEEVYRFHHDSIFVTVALLYGKKTPVGYIKHCPRKALSYLTTVETSTDMVVISPGHYNDLCERLLREFESVERYGYDTVIGSLDVWKVPVFVEIFDKYLDKKKVNKLNILNKACLSGSAEIALYLLKNGVKPDEDTDWWRLITRGRGFGEGDLDILKEIVVYLNDEMKQKLLNKACRYGSSECGMYLLSVGAKPDEYTMLYVVRGGSVDLYNTVRQYGVTPTGRGMDLYNTVRQYGVTPTVRYGDLYNTVRQYGGTPTGTDEDLYNTVRQYGVTPTGRDVFGRNVLHVACLLQRESIVADLCKDYPDLVHGTDEWGQTPLHVAAETGNCSMFQTVEKTVLKCLCRHQCLRVDGSLVHIDCECSEYMCQLVNRDGETVLHRSCVSGQKDLCLYICRSYPAMTACIDRYGRHCLHYIAGGTTDVDLFIEVENVVKKHLESLHQHHNIKTLLDGKGRSVLDLAKEGQGN
ncbi:LOW QUALITY PROTEIN: uncharacterized protein [Argopecten irradians]|uniref:LOW QUALITY PROTEIN: uncharacterized protein n=1 Tax=Argopecten irradians TaxID=31199 RepID=UPI0037115EC4